VGPAGCAGSPPPFGVRSPTSRSLTEASTPTSSIRRRPVDTRVSARSSSASGRWIPSWPRSSSPGRCTTTRACATRRSPRAKARPELPPDELLRLLRSVGDGPRLRALRLIAERPRTTQELAPLVGISEAGLSKHLHALADARVIRTERDGYYVLYSLVPERVVALPERCSHSSAATPDQRSVRTEKRSPSDSIVTRPSSSVR
jgi:DNA-binding transcriptional ArsR family regulator